MAETLGWIGVGSMGHRMTKHLLAAGHTLVVADAVSTERAPPGARIAKSNAEVAALADTIILSLPDGSVSEAVAREIAATSPRKVKTVIDTSTIGIKAAEAVAATLAGADIAFVDAPVSGGTAGADKATLAIMLACPAETYTRLKPLMSLMGKPFYVGPRPGQGQAVKLLNNYLSATALAASSEAIAFGTKQGIAMQTILDIVNASTGRNTATEDKFPRRIINEKYDAGFTAKLQLKDIKLYLDNAREAGISDEIASTVVSVWTAMDKAIPGADITLMYPYTRDGRRGK
ncbi:MAG: NAD(P)-dependent oxidoreductase [Sphingomonadales bacterium]|nr:NAD(P)-dependent oxidoreductase [Sphingomonadales bacterium]